MAAGGGHAHARHAGRAAAALAEGGAHGGAGVRGGGGCTVPSPTFARRSVRGNVTRYTARVAGVARAKVRATRSQVPACWPASGALTSARAYRIGKRMCGNSLISKERKECGGGPAGARAPARQAFTPPQRRAPAPLHRTKSPPFRPVLT